MAIDERNRVIVTEDNVKVVTVGVQGLPGAGLSFNDVQGEPTEVGIGGEQPGTSLFAARRDHKHELDVVELDAHVAGLPVSAATTAAVATETTRAQAAETANGTAIANEATTRATADTANATATAAKYTKPGTGIPKSDLASGVQTSLGTADSSVQTVNGHAGTAVSVTKADVGLGSVDNTADTAKPVSTAQQAALDAKAAITYVDAGDTASRARANHTGTQTASTISDFATAADARIMAQKGSVNGLATLDGGGKVPAVQLPSFVDDVLEYANLAAFPATGETSKIYVADYTGLIYRWGGSSYVNISASPGSTDAVPEGATHKYYTDARAAAAAPVQSVAGRGGAVALVESDVAGLTTDLASKYVKPGAGIPETDLALALRTKIDTATLPATSTTNGLVKQTVYNVRDFGAVGDGSSDDAAAIQAAITAAATAGGGTVLLPKGTYATSTSIIVSSNITLEGSGRSNTKVISGTTSDYPIVITSAAGSAKTIYNNIAIIGITFASGNNHCMYISNTSGVNIHGCEFYFTAHTFTAETMIIEYCQNVYVEENYVHDAPGDGIQINACDYFNVINNIVRDTHDDGIDIDGDFLHADSIQSTHGTVVGNTVSSITNGNGIRLESCSYMSVTGNEISNISPAGILVNSANSENMIGFSVSNNTISNCTSNGIEIVNNSGASLRDVTIVGNTLYNCGQPGGSDVRTGINLAADGILVSENYLDACGRAGGDGGSIVAYRSNNHHISDNYVTNAAGNGISVWNGSETVVYTGITISNNKMIFNAIDYSSDVLSQAGVTLTYFSARKYVVQGLNISAPSVPSSATSAGVMGDIAWDASYVYVCTAFNTWRRTAIASW